LQSLLLSHLPAQSDAEADTLAAFVDFVMMLLEFDATERVTSARARTHPFILRQPLPPTWVGLKEPRKENVLRPAVPPKKSANSMEVLPADFLSMF
jgi:serine/threonine protein kinase